MVWAAAAQHVWDEEKAELSGCSSRAQQELKLFLSFPWKGKSHEGGPPSAWCVLLCCF